MTESSHAKALVEVSAEVHRLVLVQLLCYLVIATSFVFRHWTGQRMRVFCRDLAQYALKWNKYTSSE
jgi:hypothetical protein